MIFEPMTVLTDSLLAWWSYFLGLRLLGEPTCQPRRLWGWGFIVTATAALVGGLWHGFSPYWSSAVNIAVWRVVLVCIGLADGLLGWAIVSHCAPVRWRKYLRAVVVLKGGAYLVLLVWFTDFWLAVADYLPTLALILILQAHRLRRAVEARWLTAGVMAALVAAAVQALEISLHPQFNHNDLYHLIQAGALYLLYRGGRLFGLQEV